MTSCVPTRLQKMISQSLGRIPRNGERDQLQLLATEIASIAWTRWIASRTAEDNRPEHEFVVFDNIMLLAESERRSFSDKKVATAFAFLHDSAFIHRITETEIRAASSPEEKTRLRALKAEQRLQHMELGASNARAILSQHRQFLNDQELERCVSIVAQHDLWKLGRPYPLCDDRLAVVCLEGDALWPLHPIGVLADLERPNEAGDVLDSSDPANWRRQAASSYQTLVDFRRNWNDLPSEHFPGETIFRTEKGHELCCAWREFWRLNERA